MFLVFSSVSAENSLVLNNYKINLNLETIKKGYTVSALGDKIKLSLIPGVLSSSTDIELSFITNGLPVTSPRRFTGTKFFPSSPSGRETIGFENNDDIIGLQIWLLGK